MKRLLGIVLCLALALPMMAQEEELCIDGTLLFREDFGGNDPSDPAVSMMSVPGMSSQYYNSGNSLGSGHYTVRKEGWANGIQWHRQDDHTYPDDKTRGYLLEVDGIGGAEPFYSTTIDGLCAGSKLTFSAYVVNVHYAGQLDYFGGSYVYPRMKFVLKDPTNGSVLAEKSTGDIQPDWRYGTPETWKYARDNVLSAEWQLVGMNFVVPDGIESIQMFIYNDVARNGSGNDFALDDIEIHLCAPPVTIEGEAEVCTNSSTTLTANFTNDGTFAEPLEYKWWHSTDSVTWTEMSDFNGGILTFSTIQKADSGWYKVAVSGDGNIDNINCRAVSDPFRLRVNECTEDLCIDGILLFREDFGGNDPDDPEVISDADAARAAVLGMSSGYSPCLSRTSGMSSGKFLVTKQGYQNGIQWHIMDDHTYPNDKTKGYLLQIDGRGGDAPFYTTMIEGLCPGFRLTFSAYVANVMTWGHYTNPNRDDIYPRMKFVLTDPSSGTELATYDTGDIPFDSAFIGDNSSWQYSAHWRLIGMNFTVPDNISRVKLTIFNNVPINGSGNDFVLDDIEIHLCAPPVTIAGEAEVCESTATTLTANFTNDGTFAEPLAYKWWHSTDSVTWSEMSGFNGGILSFDAIQKADSGWYKVAVSGDGNIESVNCRAMSEPFRLRVNECEPPEPPVEELCMDGILLFREDFGGNDPSAPRVSTNPVPGMSYTQATNDVFRSMGSGKYIVTKSGYCNGDTTGWSLPGADQSTYRSQWYIQDDHTYPNDYSRGYFMEIDGSGGNQQFYQTEISGLCEGIELTFSAYVANVFTWFQYDWYTRNRGPVIAPCLKFVLTNPQTGETLVEKNTQQIPFAEDLAAKTDWQYSSPWYLVGMNFIVPTGIPAIRLTIYNNVTNGNGNDFALDDIEIRLCMTPDTILTDTTVCDTLSRITWHGKEFAITDTLRDTLRSSCGFDSIYYMMRVETEHCESPCPEMHYATRDTTVCDTLMPFTWHGLLFNKPGSQTILLKDEQGCDSIEIDYTLSTFHCEDFCLEGKLLFREDFGGNAPNDPDVSCINNPSILYRNGCNTTGRLPEGYYRLTKKDQGYYNHQWVDREDHSYPNDASRGYFLMIEGANNHLFYSTFLSGGAEGDVLSFSAYVINLHDNIHDGEYQLPKILIQLINSDTQEVLANCIPSEMPIATHSEMSNWHIVGTNFTLPTDLSAIEVNMYAYMHGHEGNDFGIDDIELRLCQIPQATRVDTIICDTIDAITWRNKIYPLKNELRDTVYDSSGADSIYYILNVIMEHCCPEIKEKTITIGTLCDTLLPYTLYFRDTVLTFKMAGDLLLEFQHPQWDCIDSIYTLHLDTIHCERLYDIIVNKYNWQLLCDNVALRNFFPELTATAFQWYKNEQAIPGATGDDYAERNELRGVFQLNVHLNDGRSIWSNIIEIEGPEDAPTRVQIYNSQGMPVSEGQMTRGVYLYRYEKGEERWTEKKIVL